MVQPEVPEKDSKITLTGAVYFIFCMTCNWVFHSESLE